MTPSSLTELIQKAETAGACPDELKTAKSLTSWEEAIRHPEVAYWAVWYAKHVLESRWPDIEHLITQPQHAYFYARHCVKSRWLEAESLIATDPQCAYWYARHVIKGRWLEAEPTILTSPEWVFWYACDVLKARWLEAEPTILTYPKWADSYKFHFKISSDTHQ